MDVAEPPRVVFESPAKCADGHRAQELLEEALARARAPGPGWRVTMRVQATSPGVLHADGEIADEHGAPVGHRAFDRKAVDCGGLARAIGVWASLVLDAEMNRPRNVVRADETTPPAPAAEDEADPPDGGARANAKRATTATAPGASEAQPPPSPWPGPPPGETLPADRDSPGRHDEARTLEVGAGAFLMTGTGAGLMAGGTPFAVIEASKGVFVRPALVFGQSLPSSGPDVSLVATRVDGCLRVAGLYTSRNGMQLDLCGGTDLGVLEAGRTVPYVGFGPSLDLRGELGGDLAALLRGLFDVNAVQTHGDSLDTPLWAGRVELAMSWRVQ